MSVLTSLHLTLIKDIVRMSLSEYAQASYNYIKEYALTIVLCTCWFKQSHTFESELGIIIVLGVIKIEELNWE